MTRSLKLIVSCEHASNRIPVEYRDLFAGSQDVLDSHQGWDPGVIELVAAFEKVFQTKVELGQWSRLLVELNRSLGHPKLFSQFTRELSKVRRDQIIGTYYLPYRQSLNQQAQAIEEESGNCLHLSLHTFTPNLKGDVRNADIGLLYDPKNESEKAFAKVWRLKLQEQLPEWVIRMNYPYRGNADGFTTWLRRRHAGYAGLELEVNQKYFYRDTTSWRSFSREIAAATKLAVEAFAMTEIH